MKEKMEVQSMDGNIGQLPIYKAVIILIIMTFAIIYGLWPADALPLNPIDDVAVLGTAVLLSGYVARNDIQV